MLQSFLVTTVDYLQRLDIFRRFRCEPATPQPEHLNRALAHKRYGHDNPEAERSTCHQHQHHNISYRRTSTHRVYNVRGFEPLHLSTRRRPAGAATVRCWRRIWLSGFEKRKSRGPSGAMVRLHHWNKRQDDRECIREATTGL